MRELAVNVEETVAEALGYFVAQVVDLTALYGVGCCALLLNIFHAVVEDLESGCPWCLYCVESTDRTPAEGRCGQPWPESGWLHCRVKAEAGAMEVPFLYVHNMKHQRRQRHFCVNTIIKGTSSTGI